MTELVTNGKELLFTNRRKTAPIGQLSPKQLAWCSKRWPWFADRRRVVPLEKK